MSVYAKILVFARSFALPERIAKTPGFCLNSVVPFSRDPSLKLVGFDAMPGKTSIANEAYLNVRRMRSARLDEAEHETNKFYGRIAQLVRARH